MLLRLGLGILLLLSTTIGGGATTTREGGAVTVEEVLAVVDRTPILRSDLALAALVQLAEPDPGESVAAFESRLLDLRIRLELQLRDLEASGVLYRLEPQVERTQQELVHRAGGQELLQSRLQELGLIPSDLEELALRVAAAAAYVEQRLRPQVTVRPEEVEQEYQRLVQNELLPRDAPVPPLQELEPQLRRLLAERKLNGEIDSWMARARERLEVTRFVP